MTLLCLAPSIVHVRCTVSTAEIEEQIATVTTMKATVSGVISNWLARDMVPVLADPITHMDQLYLQRRVRPATVEGRWYCPLSKVPHPARLHKGFRPTSLTLVLSNLAGKHVRELLMEYVEYKVDPHQFVSLPWCSTVHATIEHHNWLQAREGWCNHPDITTVLYFQKAFDRVEHHILLTKTANTGLPDFVTRSITLFFFERHQFVKVGKVTSEWVQINHQWRCFSKGHCSVQRIFFYMQMIFDLHVQQPKMSTIVLSGKDAAPVVPTVILSPVLTRLRNGHVKKDPPKLWRNKKIVAHVGKKLHSPTRDCRWDREMKGDRGC